jgi:hypothetical protein
MQRCSLKLYFKASTLLPTTWSDDNLGCNISPIIGYKWTRNIGESPHSLEFIENHILFTSQGGWNLEDFASFAFKLEPWCANLFFKVTMLHNAKVVFKEDNQFNLVTWLWRKMFTSSIFNHKLLEYIKLVEIVVV